MNDKKNEILEIKLIDNDCRCKFDNSDYHAHNAEIVISYLDIKSNKKEEISFVSEHMSGKDIYIYEKTTDQKKIEILREIFEKENFEKEEWEEILNIKDNKDWNLFIKGLIDKIKYDNF